MFRENIRKHYDHLSRSYRRVADYLLTDYHSAAFMTAAALAQAVDVDTTTVVRFAQRLGYPGFPELIEDVQEQVKAELGQVYAAPAAAQTPTARVQYFLAQDRSSVDKALAQNPAATIEAVLEMLRTGTRIIVMGESYAAPIAASFAGMLRAAGLPAIYAGADLYEQAELLSSTAHEDVVVGMTPLDGVSSVARALRYARSEGARTVVCTPVLNSQAARAAEYLLYAPGEAQDTLPSLTGLYAMTGAIAMTLASLQPEEAQRRRSEANRVLEELF
jgi:DNA-binding MurR/RpiR family transcriptional regulator